MMQPAIDSAALDAALSRQVSAYCPHQPTPKQAAALIALDLRKAVLYGGAAGGGKTDWLLMGALEHVDLPGYNAIIFRRTFPQLNAPDGPILRLQEWLTAKLPRDAWNASNHRWTFPSGATLSLGTMQYLKDRLNHQGAAYQFIGFDELTQFEQGQFTYLFSRARRPAAGPGSGIPIRVAATSNPGGPGHVWVAKAWGLGEWEGNAEGLGKVPGSDLAFIGAKLEDNPHLDTAAYEEALMFLPELERNQLRKGDWHSRPRGDLLPIERIHIIGPDELPDGLRPMAEGEERGVRALRIVRFWDFASSGPRKGSRQPDYTASSKDAYDRKPDRFYMLDGSLDLLEPGPLEVLLRDTAVDDGQRVEQHQEQEPGASGKSAVKTNQKLLRGYSMTGHPATGPKRARWLGFRAAVEQGRVYAVRGPWLTPFLERLDALTTDEAADERDDVKDDPMDAVSGSFNLLVGVTGKRFGVVGRVRAPT